MHHAGRVAPLPHTIFFTVILLFHFSTTQASGTGFDPNTRWSDSFGPNSGCNGNVSAAIESADGSIIFGGRFTACGGIDAQGLVVYEPANDTWRTLEPDGATAFNGSISAMARYDGDLFVGGYFSQLEDAQGNTLIANRIVRWDGTSWHAVGNGGGEGLNNALHSLYVYNNRLIAGGLFTQANIGASTPTSANRIVAWDGSSWSALGDNGGNGFDGSVNALSEFNGELIAGGLFSQANADASPSVSANNVARWNGSTWQSLGDNGVDGGTFALSVFQSELYVGGSFWEASAGGPDAVSARNLAKWDGSNWSMVGAHADDRLSGSVWAMDATADHLYIGGGFGYIGLENNEWLTVNRIIRWDGTAWQPMGTGAGVGVYGPGAVRFIKVISDQVYLGGFFTAANHGQPIPANRVARWDTVGEQWFALGNDLGGQGADTNIRTSLQTPLGLVVAGDFTAIGGTQANSIALGDGTAWQALGSGGGNGLDGSPRTLAWYDGELYAAGGFITANLNGSDEITVGYIARWDGTVWQPVGSDGGNGVNGHVNAMAVMNGALYVGGSFSQANVGGTNSPTVNGFAKWDGATWQPVGSDGGTGTDGEIHALATNGTEMYAGGYFSSVNIGAASPLPAGYLARWDGAQWTTVGTNGGDGANGIVLTLAFGGSTLFVGGSFTQTNVGGSSTASTSNIAQWDGTEWSQVGSGVYGNVYTIATDEDMVYLGGDFSRTFGSQRSNVARWNGIQWSSLGSGVDRSVNTLTINGDGTLTVGGNFNRAGSAVSDYIAEYATEGTLSTTIVGSGGGSVTTNPAGIDCPGTCTDVLAWDQVITLSALPDSDSVFLGWQGSECTGPEPCDIFFEESTNVTADFARLYSVLPSASAGGSIQPDTTQIVVDGETIDFELSAEVGYSLDAVSGTCGGSLNGITYTTNTIATDCSVAATFQLNSYVLDAFVVDGQGSVTPATQIVDHGADAILTVSPAGGWSVQSVTGNNCSAEQANEDEWIVRNLTQACSVGVVFLQGSFEVNATVSAGEGVVSPEAQKVAGGENASWTVTPATDWGISSVAGDTCTPSNVGGNQWIAVSIVADCTISVAFEPLPRVSVEPSTVMFKDVAVGDSETSDIVIIQNAGPGKLELGNLTIQGDQTTEFGILSDTDLCSGSTLQAEEFCSLRIRFAPLADGLRQANLIIPSNEPDTPSSIPLLGDRDVLFSDRFVAPDQE